MPRDLETIVLKAMARDPAHRYETADAIAEDLRRFLDDRPIRARRASVVERSLRWCRRNPIVTGLASAVGLALILGTTVAMLLRHPSVSGGGAGAREEGLAVENARRADREARRAREETLLSDHRLYLARMRLAMRAWQEGQTDLVQQFLMENGRSGPRAPTGASSSGTTCVESARLSALPLLGHCTT